MNKTTKLDKKYIKLIARLLELASDQFANHVCNDFDLSEFLPSISDRRKLAEEIHKSDGDSNTFNPNDTYDNVPDYWLMSYFSKFFEQLVR